MNTRQKNADTLRIAMQKNGRLRDASERLLQKCGLNFSSDKESLLIPCKNFPAEILLVRDDDIPQLVANEICHLGIVGRNVFAEQEKNEFRNCRELRSLGFGECRLAIATPRDQTYRGPESLEGSRIATTYPQLLDKYLRKNGIRARIISVSGSVEIAPMLNIADAICDLVATGTTLRSHGLEERDLVLESEGILIGTLSQTDPNLQSQIDRLLLRIDGVQAARQSKYIMLNTHRSNLERIAQIIPGMEKPTVIPLEGTHDFVALHAVARENIFWETIETLKAHGASSILVVPIEKIIE
jgi:ATP phosphoribosyltransferase